MPHIFEGALNVILILCRPEKTYELIRYQNSNFVGRKKKGEKLSECSRTFLRSIILYHFIANCSGQKNNKPLLCIKWPFKKSVARRKMLVALILGYLQAACALPFWYVMEKLEL